MALAGGHTRDPGQSQQWGDGGGGGGGACERAGGDDACTCHACGCRMGSPEMPEDSAKYRVGQGQSDADHV